MKITRAVVPSLFTVLNMFCGLMSIIHASRGEYDTAAWLIILAALFDSLDGIMARITKSSSWFGVQFDSLSDVVSFGAAPAFLVYQVHLHTFGGLGIILSSMLMIFGALRLARFNVQLVGHNKEFFKGLPIPPQGVTIAAYVLAYYQGTAGLSGAPRDLLAPFVIVLSFLMVSSVKYDTIPSLNRRSIRKHPVRFALFVAAATAVVVTKGEAIFPVMVVFILSGLMRYTITTLRKLVHHGESPEQESEATSFDA
ncbi:MAG: CDP-diacylglycerol--serine O-phosphatidyltransferase [Bacteroidota bacterium]